MSRVSFPARFAPWIAIISAIIATLTFTHNGLSEVQKIPSMRADIDSLKARVVTDAAWKHDMAYMACVNFQQSRPATEVPAICKSATK